LYEIFIIGHFKKLTRLLSTFAGAKDIIYKPAQTEIIKQLLSQKEARFPLGKCLQNKKAPRQLSRIFGGVNEGPLGVTWFFHSMIYKSQK